MKVFAPVRVLIVCLFLACGLFARASDSQGQILLMLSLDGFRSDYLEKYAPPTLLKLASGGVRAERMIPSFPSLTFPNHYSLVTGLHPSRHGITTNTIYDPDLNETFTLRNNGPKDGRWWGGEPIWRTAEKQGVRAACVFWPGSEAPIAGGHASDWCPYDHSLMPDQVVDRVLDLLARPEETRPQLVNFYMHHTDSAGHMGGPDSKLTGDAVALVDTAIARLLTGLEKLGLRDRVNFLVVADHGMAAISQDRLIHIEDYVSPAEAKVDYYGTVAGLRPIGISEAELYQKFKDKSPHFAAYTQATMPARFHYTGNHRIPPVVLVAEEGWYILEKGKSTHGLGAHGYDPELPSMGAVFIANGPAFKIGLTIAPFDNIEVYDLLCTMLRLHPADNEGTGTLAAKVLKSSPVK